MSDDEGQAAVGLPEWQQVDAKDVIERLRRRISDLEYEADLHELQIRNLLKQTGE